MCGIAGSINFQLDEADVFRSLYHRGPDDNGLFQYSQIQLFACRLAIQDKESGHQPFLLGDELVLVFNGEIYNHWQLRIEHHLNCTTRSDAETLLLLYDKYGEKCLEMLDGMFAFAIYDKRRGKLFLGRDRAGEKPFYYYKKGKYFVFASELNTLTQRISLQINETNIFEYLRLGYNFKKNTAYKDVFELEAGRCAWIDVNTLDFVIKKYWDIGTYYAQESKDSYIQAMDQVEYCLKKSVERQIKTAEVQVGTFLSGGIDSGLVTAIAAQHVDNLKTFTVSFEGEYDEAPLAKMVATRYQTNHHVFRLSYDQLPHEVEGIMARYGEPFFDSSAIPSYYISKAAKEFVTVVLSGDGADELFGGYKRYVPFAVHDFFQKNKFRQTSAGFLNKIIPISNEKKSIFNYLNRLVFQSSRYGLDAWLAATQDIYEGFEEELKSHALPFELLNHFEAINKQDISSLKKIQWLDFDALLAGDFLVKMDIATMANSLEARNPYLCKDLLEYAPRLPSSYMVHRKTTKRLLREVAKKYLPDELLNQPKRGFEVPLKKWVNFNLKEIIGDYLSAPNAYFLQFVNADFIHKLLANNVKISQEKRAKIIWSLFSLEIWHKHFMTQQQTIAKAA